MLQIELSNTEAETEFGVQIVYEATPLKRNRSDIANENAKLWYSSDKRVDQFHEEFLN